MPKKVKTKKQKMQADIKRKTYSSTPRQADRTVYSLSSEVKSAPIKNQEEKISYSLHTSKSVTAAHTYPHLASDLKKTIILTISIVVFQIAIKLLLNI